MLTNRFRTSPQTSRFCRLVSPVLTRVRSRAEHGAVAVEMAIVALMLVPLACGMIDFGVLMQKDQTLETAVRMAARTGVQSCVTTTASCVDGSLPSDDYRVLQAINGALRGSAADIDFVVVFRVPATQAGVVRPECLAGVSVDHLCNVYDTSWLTKTPDKFTCPIITSAPGVLPVEYATPVSPPQFWDACGRNRNGLSADHLGVFVRLKHKYATGLFGQGRTLNKQAVFRLEPLPTPKIRAHVIPLPPGATLAPVSATTTEYYPPTTAATTTSATTLAPPVTATTTPATTAPDTSTTTDAPTTVTTLDLSTSTTTTITTGVPVDPGTTDAPTTVTTSMAAAVTTAAPVTTVSAPVTVATTAATVATTAAPATTKYKPPVTVTTTTTTTLPPRPRSGGR
jgi:TadE-like protein